MIKKKWLMLALLLMSWLASVPAISQTKVLSTKHSFSVVQAVEYAAKNNIQVKNALLVVKTQEQTNREITAAAFPQINGNIGTTYNPNVAVQTLPNFISPATYQVLINEGVKNGSGQPISMPNNFDFIQAQFGTKYNASAGVSVQQLLFDGQVFVGLQARKLAMDFQQKNVEVTEEAIRTNIYKIYYQLVASKTQIDLLDANINRLEKLEADTKIIYKNGFAEKLDLDKIAVQVANLRTLKNTTEAGISNGYLGLKTLMGMPVRDTLILTDKLTFDELKNGVLTDTGFQYTQRKDYQFVSLAKRLNEYNVKRYKLSYLPTLALSANYSKIAQRNSFDFFSKGDWFTVSSVGLNIAVPIFDGFSKDAKMKKAKIDVQTTANQLNDLQNQINYQILQATNNLTVAISTMDYQKKNMELAENVYNQTKKKYEVGTGSNIEITGAQTDLVAAQTNYINALYNAIIAKVDYTKAIGKL